MPGFPDLFTFLKKLFFPWMRLELDFLFHFWPFPNYSCLTYSLLFPVFSFVLVSAGSFVLENRKGDERCQSMIIMIMWPGLHDSKTMLFQHTWICHSFCGDSEGRECDRFGAAQCNCGVTRQMRGKISMKACHWVNQKAQGVCCTTKSPLHRLTGLAEPLKMLVSLPVIFHFH